MIQQMRPSSISSSRLATTTAASRFTADVRILRPIERTARGLFLDVPNRGSSIFPRMLEPGPMGPSTQLTEGFLLRRGFSIVTCGWQHDVPRGNGRFGLSAPLALQNGQPLIGQVTTTSQIDAPTDVLAPDSNYVPFEARFRNADASAPTPMTRPRSSRATSGR